MREEDEGVGCPFFFFSLSFSKGHGVTGAEENTIETQGVVNRVLFFFLLLAWMECRPFFFFFFFFLPYLIKGKWFIKVHVSLPSA